MHVDGFRFDLASALARELYDVDRLGSFFDTITQDPVLSQVKLIAEPWDVGAGGYQVGNFPPGWNEWNDKYRDSMRSYWKGDGGLIGEFARRFTGSADLYEASGRKPHASINFVTAHDGFTLQDLVSYNDKHNEANGEDNRDGNDNNRSWNCGVEGETDDPLIRNLRMHQRRNLMATLLLSQGVPMILSGDEIGHSQGGNNNAYCQDNTVSWLNWDLNDEQKEFLGFVQQMVALRRSHPVFARRQYLRGRGDITEIIWLTPSGAEMTEVEWNQHFARCLGVYLAGDNLKRTDRRGRPIRDDNFLVLFNAHYEKIDFMLPKLRPNSEWWTVLDTSADKAPFDGQHWAAGTQYPLQGRSLALFTEVGGG